MMEENAKKFMEEYRKLVEKYKLTFVSTPKFIQRDDGTFSVVIKIELTEVKKGIDK